MVLAFNVQNVAERVVAKMDAPLRIEAKNAIANNVEQVPDLSFLQFCKLLIFYFLCNVYPITDYELQNAIFIRIRVKKTKFKKARAIVAFYFVYET